MSNDQNTIEELEKQKNIRIIPVIGYSKSGKTSSIEKIIGFLKSKGYRVIALKHIHQENFTFDQPGKNTWRYTQAGAKAIVAQSNTESALLFNWQLPLEQILRILHAAGVEAGEFTGEKPLVAILEGFRDIGKKRILCASNLQEIKAQINPSIALIAGVISSDEKEAERAKGEIKIPIVDLLNKPEAILPIFNLFN